MYRIFALLLLLSACSTNSLPFDASSDVSPSITVAAGDTFSLGIGQVAAIRGSDYRIAFAEVVNDSRCPTDVTCVWEGDAEVRLGLARAGSSWEWNRVHTQPAQSSASISGFVIHLLSLRPSPNTKNPVRATDYVVELSIRTD